MYTQCPECEVAFRVSAEILKQAAGKVCCGGCGIAFNALEYLSEQKPSTPPKSDPNPDPQLPELTPEAPGEIEAGTPPKSISAKQSAALLETLDQLAGSDIRIEDTGVEWRVLSEDDVNDEIIAAEADLIADTGMLTFIAEGEEDVLKDEPFEVIEEMRFDDNTPLPDESDYTDEPPRPSEVLAEEQESEPEAEEIQVDLALGNSGEWQGLLGDLEEPAAADTGEEPANDAEIEVDGAVEEQTVEPEDDLVTLAETVSEDVASEPLDVDTQFAIQAEAMGIDLSGIHDSAEEEQQELEPEVDEELKTSNEEDWVTTTFEREATEQAAEEVEKEELDEDELEEEGKDEEIEIEIDTDIALVDQDEIDDDVDDIASVFDDKVEEDIGELSASLDDSDDDEPVQEIDAAEESSEQVIPEMTEEEKTINMMIDQELFNMAFEDEDGVASTIMKLRPNIDAEGNLEENKKEIEQDDSPFLETIIMQSEFGGGDQDKNRLATEKAVESKAFEDPGVSFPLKKTMRGVLRGGNRETNLPRFGMIAGALALLLLLLLQVMHQSRESLATASVFNQTVGPLYRMLGSPLTPSWDISGWRFEATKGSTEVLGEIDDSAQPDNAAQNEEQLTIYSRVGNKSDEALPYPLVHLSLTDRFEEIIGSRVLEPSEYLAENADPRRPVPPGTTFNAVFSIESPSAEATGFKLNVCYRLASGQLRCAIEDFK